MAVQDRMRKYRREGGGADLVRVEVLVPAEGRDEVLALAADLRAKHRARQADLAYLCEEAMARYRARILDNVDPDRLPDIRQRAAVIARALIEKGDARAFVLGRRILDAAEP